MGAGGGRGDLEDERSQSGWIFSASKNLKSVLKV